MRALVVGSGGREHALAWKLAQSPHLDELHAAPGNPGIAALGTCHPVRPDDAEGLLELTRTLEIDLVVIGPEAPLVAGVADELRHAGVSVFGPSAAAARIEGSKSFAKDVMDAAGLPNPRRLAEPAAPCVIKVDGLAAGKGVFVCRTADELEDGLRRGAALGGQLVFEELVEGEELSVFALCDGSAARPLGAARDYKRAEDGDAGPNTGGMGSFSPVDGFDAGRVAELVETIHAPVLEELARRGGPFVGVLFAGLMLTADGPTVLEFNCRFGDPEAQSILASADGDLLPALADAAAGKLGGLDGVTSGGAAVTVVVAAGSYPEGTDSGSPIDGVAAAEETGALVFHAGTARSGGSLVTNGGRILAVTGRGAAVADARAQAYAGAERISFAGARYRRDIAGG
ncbi:MAG TPA: phosphoribosylamine--glycine ligase [Gaiellaceae bacterium]|nr:phosphoribosylamine--glycine ligase [Gaiellaceae bacterium]